MAEPDANWRPREDVFQVGDFETRLKFPVCKLVDKLESEWKDDVSLPVQMARAQIESLRTAGDPEGRFRAKWQLVRSLYRAGYNADDVRELFRLIDWMMHLRGSRLGFLRLVFLHERRCGAFLSANFGTYQNVFQYAWSISNGSTDALKSWSTGSTP